MRKLIVLIMTSVLATGAVANADTVDVTADPGKLIRIVELQKVPRGTDTASRTSLAIDEELKVYDDITTNGIENYTIDLEVVDEGDLLKQVAVCFYDSDALTGPAIGTTCGSGFDNLDTITPSDVNAMNDANGDGVFLPQSAVQMGFVPSFDVGDNRSVKHAVDTSTHEFEKAHLVLANGSAASSLISQQSQFNGDTIGVAADNNVWNLSFRLGLRKFAHSSSDWKIRVLATYDGATPSDPDQVVELIDTKTYTVGYFGAFDAVERPSQDFQNVIDGGFKEITGITTGEYFVNSASDIAIEASAFKDSGEPVTTLIFGATSDPADGEVSMKCVGNKDGSIEQFMVASTSKKLLGAVPANSAETTLVGATSPKVAPTHDCTLYVGDDVATGTYTNVMTVAIGKAG